MNAILIIVLVLAVSVLIIAWAAYYVCVQKAKVVGILKDGVLAYIQEANATVYVEDSPQLAKPTLGEIIRIKHPLTLNLKRAKNQSRLPWVYNVPFGCGRAFVPDELKEGVKAAILLHEFSNSQWVAKCQDGDVIIYLNDDGHTVGDEVAFVSSNKRLQRFYYV